MSTTRLHLYHFVLFTGMLVCLAKSETGLDAEQFSNTIHFIEEFLKFQRKIAPPAITTAFLCWGPEKTHKATKYLSEKGFLLSVHFVDDHDALIQYHSQKRNAYSSFVLDLDCPTSQHFLKQANKMDMMFRAHNRWLLIKNSVNITSDINDHSVCSSEMCRDIQTRTELLDRFAQLHVLLDSDVTAAVQFRNGEFMLFEIYRRHATTEIIMDHIGIWEKDRGVKLKVSMVITKRRMNLQGTRLKVGVVATFKDTEEHLEDGVNQHLDTLSKAFHAEFKHLATMINITIDNVYSRKWGSLVNGSYTGLSGQLFRYEVDVSSTGLFILKDRMPAMEYIHSPIPSKSAFLFRPPPLSFLMNIFTLPFSRSVWAASASLVGFTGFMLYIAYKWEFWRDKRLEQLQESDKYPTWSDVVLMSLGAICQQGTTLEATGVTIRTLTILLFVSMIFLYTSYSACIVALLQSTTDSIRTLEDLYKSGLGVGVMDTAYNRHYFTTATDPLRRAIYKDRVSPPGGKENFFNLVDGMEKVRHGLYAFHHELDLGNRVISDTFQEDEKCGLQTVVYFYDFSDPYVAVPKRSPLKEIVSIGYRMIHERGIQYRTYWNYYTKKPKCEGGGSSFVSVGIVDCYPAILVLVYGLSCSAAIMILEVLFNKRLHEYVGKLEGKLKRNRRLFERRNHPAELY